MAATVRSRREVRSPLRLAQRRRRFRIIWGTLLGLLLAGLVGALVYVSYLPVFAIQKVEITGAEDIGETEVQSVIQQIVSDGKFHLLSPRTVLTYPRKYIEVDLLERFKRIKKINVWVDFTLRPTLHVAITPRIPYARWCIDETLAECFIVDADGYIFAPLITEVPLEERVVYTQGLEYDASPVGQLYLKDTWRGIQAFIAELKRGEKPVRTIRAVDEFDYEAVLESGVLLKLSYARAPSDALQDLISALNSDALKGKESQIEYVDLRFAGRVYYLLRSEQ